MNCSYLHCTQQDMNWNKWNVYYPQDFPRQTTGTNDCGVIVCLFIYTMMTGAKLQNRDFLPHRTMHFRKLFSSYLMANSIEKPASATIRNRCLGFNIFYSNHEINIIIVPFCYLIAWTFEIDNITNATFCDRDSEAENVPEMAGEFYANAQRSIEDGSLAINRVWKSVPEIPIQTTHQVPTPLHCAAFMHKAFNATDKKCGSKSGCRVNGARRMHLCELCREWVHWKCIGDQRTPPAGSNLYHCPLHQSGKKAISCKRKK